MTRSRGVKSGNILRVTRSNAWILQQESTGHRHHKKDSGKNHAGSPPAEAWKQHQVRKCPKQRRSAAESCERQADGQARSVREPLSHHRNHGSVSESGPDPSQDPVEKIQKVEIRCE